jgi:chaperonin GroEL
MIKNRVNQIKVKWKLQLLIMTKKNYRNVCKLAGGVAVLYVGAASEVEMKEKKRQS